MTYDAKDVERWLLQDDNWGGIIQLVDKFSKQRITWTKERINAAFCEVFEKSEKVGW